MTRVIALVILAWLLAVTGHESVADVPLTVDGVPVAVDRGATLRDVAEVRAATRPGRMLSAAAGHSVISE